MYMNIICENCSREFPRGRKIARFCSQKCRVYFNRKADSIKSGTASVVEGVCPLCNSSTGAKYTDKDVREMIAEALAGYTARIKILEDQLKDEKVQTINVSGVAETVVNYEE